MTATSMSARATVATAAHITRERGFAYRCGGPQRREKSVTRIARQATTITAASQVTEASSQRGQDSGSGLPVAPVLPHPLPPSFYAPSPVEPSKSKGHDYRAFL
ncbi:MAG: hypothetical protein QOF43_1656 [Gaiellaceae bacterium]|nr:hypothetical protein [Gaiellaceae bacterium]